MTCEDCIHHELCVCVGTRKLYPGSSEGCRFFENKYRFVKMPCKIGDTLYDVYEAVNNGYGNIQVYRVKDLRFLVDKRGRVFLNVNSELILLDDFGKTVFLTREEAEAALAVMGK